MSFFSVRDASSFLFRSSKFSALSRHEAPYKSSQGFNWCSQLLFLFIILLLPEFFIEALHGGSSRILFILQVFFKTSLEVMIRQAILKIKHGAQHMFCFQEFKNSSSCIPKCNSFYLIFWDGDMSFLTIWVCVSWFTCCQEWGILNPSLSSLELSWVRLHLKPSLRNVAMVPIDNPSFHLFSRWNKFFHLFGALNQINGFH